MRFLLTNCIRRPSFTRYVNEQRRDGRVQTVHNGTRAFEQRTIFFIRWIYSAEKLDCNFEEASVPLKGQPLSMPLEEQNFKLHNILFLLQSVSSTPPVGSPVVNIPQRRANYSARGHWHGIFWLHPTTRFQSIDYISGMYWWFLYFFHLRPSQALLSTTQQ